MTVRPARVLRGALIGVLGAAAGAAGQAPERPASALRLGPVDLQPGFQITNLGVDTNVFNEATAPKRDTTAVVMPSVAVMSRSPRVQVRSKGQLQLVYFREYENQRAANWSSDARLDVPLGHVTPFVSWAGLQSRERPTLEIDVRARRSVQTASSGLSVQATPKVALLASVQRTRTSFAASDDATGQTLRESLTGTARQLAFGTRLALTPITTLTVNVQRQQDRFDFSSGRDADSTRVTVGIDGAPRSRLEGRAEVGVRRFDVRAPGVPDFLGAVAAVDLGYRLGGSQQIRVRATRDVAYSFSVTEPYFVLTGADATYVHRFSERLEGLASLGRYRLAYREVRLPGVVSGPVSPDLVGRVDTAGVGVGIYATRQVRFGITAEATRRVGGPRSSFDGLRLFSSIVYLP